MYMSNELCDEDTDHHIIIYSKPINAALSKQLQSQPVVNNSLKNCIKLYRLTID